MIKTPFKISETENKQLTEIAIAIYTAKSSTTENEFVNLMEKAYRVSRQIVRSRVL